MLPLSVAPLTLRHLNAIVHTLLFRSSCLSNSVHHSPLSVAPLSVAPLSFCSLSPLSVAGFQAQLSNLIVAGCQAQLLTLIVAGCQAQLSTLIVAGCQAQLLTLATTTTKGGKPEFVLGFHIGSWVKKKKMGESRESVQQAFAKFVGRRSHIIKAFVDEGKLFQKTIVEDTPYRTNIFGEQERRVLQVELDDELVNLLPSSTMPLNFTTRKISDMDWIYRLCTYFDAWLVSIALKCVGHDDRKLLVKEIKKRASISQVISALGCMKSLVQCRRQVDSDCHICGKSASSVYWNWCGTCKDDELRQYCNFCESNYDQCQSCFSDFAEVVRCSDKFYYRCSAEW